MQKVILYISPQIVNSNTEADFVRVDLMEEELIAVTQVIQDVKDIEKLFTDYSKTFNLPASKTNNKLFKYWFNPDVNNFNSQVFSTAKIELNHFEFKQGKIQLNEVVMKDNKPSMYKVTFFGDTVSFKNEINEDQLSDLAWLSNFDFVEASGETDNIKEGLTNGLNFTVDSVTYNDAIIFPLITHTGSYVFNSLGDFDNPYNVSTAATQHNKRGVLTEDLKPAITIKLILKAIEQQYGITFKSGEFFDSNVFTNLYLWLHRDKGKMVLAGTWLNDGQSYNGTGDVSELTDTSAGWGYFVESTGIYTWRSWVFEATQPSTLDETTISVTITPTSAYVGVPYNLSILTADNYSVKAQINSVSGTQTLTLIIGGPNGIPITDISANPRGPNNIISRLISEQAIEFNAEITINRKINYIVTLSGFPPQNIVRNYTATFTPAVALQSPAFGKINILEQVPKLKVKDFLNGLFRQFNLTVFSNFQNEIIVKTLDDFYAGGETQDLTEYIKTDENTVADVIPFSEVDFEYEDPETILAQRFELLNNQKYGELNYRVDVSKKNIYQIKLPFSQMLFERLFDVGLSNYATDIQVGTSIDEELNPSIGAPLIFYGIRIVGADDSINYVANTTRPADGSLPASGTKSILDDYFIPSVCNELGTSTTPPTHNLNFGSEINTYTLTDYAGINNSLFQKYYQNYITRVFNTRTRLFKFEAVLPLKVLLTLTLDDLVIVGTRAYTINKMTTKLQSGETSFELLNEPN